MKDKEGNQFKVVRSIRITCLRTYTFIFIVAILSYRKLCETMTLNAVRPHCWDQQQEGVMEERKR